MKEEINKDRKEVITAARENLDVKLEDLESNIERIEELVEENLVVEETPEKVSMLGEDEKTWGPAS